MDHCTAAAKEALEFSRKWGRLLVMPRMTAEVRIKSWNPRILRIKTEKSRLSKKND